MVVGYFKAMPLPPEQRISTSVLLIVAKADATAFTNTFKDTIQSKVPFIYMVERREFPVLH